MEQVRLQLFCLPIGCFVGALLAGGKLVLLLNIIVCRRDIYASNIPVCYIPRVTNI